MVDWIAQTAGFTGIFREKPPLLSWALAGSKARSDGVTGRFSREKILPVVLLTDRTAVVLIRSMTGMPTTINGGLTTTEASAISGLSDGQLRKLARQGVIVAQRGRRDWFIDPASLDAYMHTERKPGPKATHN